VSRVKGRGVIDGESEDGNCDEVIHVSWLCVDFCGFVFLRRLHSGFALYIAADRVFRSQSAVYEADYWWGSEQLLQVVVQNAYQRLSC